MSKTFNLKLDGLVCPLPVARTKKKLNEMEIGDILEVSGDFGESGENIKRYIEKHGDSILEFKIEGEDLMARALQHEIEHLDGILFIASSSYHRFRR